MAKPAIAYEDRAAILQNSRLRKMAASAHAYVRGNTAKFYDWLGASRAAKRVPRGPPIWICGDCHLGNLGPVADAEGRVDIQIRDLDQTVIGNPAHDLIRLGLSLATAARGSDLPGITTTHMLEEMVTGYAEALGDPDANRAAEPNVVRAVRRRALGRRWKHLARERIETVEPSIPLGTKFWALAPEERRGIAELLGDPAIEDMVLALNDRDADGRLRLHDAAYWKKGCSSLGLLRYAALIGVRGSKDKEEAIALVDLKEAVPSVAPAAIDAAMPGDPAERVVAGARALAPNLGERMIAAKLLGRPVVVRELMPQDLKIEVDQFSRREAVQAARYLAFVIGRAHGRQMDRPTAEEWRKTLTARRSRTIDAPSWLWRSVVELAGRHEAGYLEHCRLYALADQQD